MSTTAPIERREARAAAEELSVEGLQVAIGGHPVLRGADLRVAAGSLVALLGPSGCGKTTLLRAVAGLIRPGGGRVAAGDRTLSDGERWVAPERRRIGMVFQDPSLFPHMTVAKNVGYGLPRAERRGPRVEELLRLVGLVGIGDRLPDTLSGGQQQRVALARALAPRPAALLLDEPFSALDAPLRAQLRREVRTTLAALGTTALFVTHDQEEAFLLGDEVAVMLDGRIVQQAPPAELYERPAGREVVEFLGDGNLVLGIAAGGTAETPLGPVPLVDHRIGPVDVMVRPEQIELSSGGACQVESVEYYGHDTAYLIRAWGGPPIRVRALGPPAFAEGAPVALRYRGASTVAFGGG